jgi:acylphosphatase
MKKHLVCIISGRVQGVLYRVFVRYVAKSLNLCGVVKNLSDGTVRVEAEGDEEKLALFVSALKKGSTFSKVAEVGCNYSDALSGFKNFNIEF